jgi:hypothetical protein
MANTPQKHYPDFRKLLEPGESEESCPCPRELDRVIKFVEEKKFSAEGAGALIETFGSVIDFATQGDKKDERKLKGRVKNFTVDFKKLTEDFLKICEKFWEITWRNQPLEIRGNPRIISKDTRIKRAGIRSRIVLEIIAENMGVLHKYEIAIPEESLAKTGS